MRLVSFLFTDGVIAVSSAVGIEIFNGVNINMIYYTIAPYLNNIINIYPSYINNTAKLQGDYVNTNVHCYHPN
jgi:hypothetical protein